MTSRAPAGANIAALGRRVGGDVGTHVPWHVTVNQLSARFQCHLYTVNELINEWLKTHKHANKRHVPVMVYFDDVAI